MGDTDQNGKALLLRLLNSDHFTPSLAIKYLLDCQETGTQYYLCRLLRRFSEKDIEYVLPQLCHLATVFDRKMVKYFLAAACRKSSHIANCVSWYLEHYLNDARTKQDETTAAKYLRLLSQTQLLSASSPEAETNGESFFDEIGMLHTRKNKDIPAWLVGVGVVLGHALTPRLFSQPRDMFLLHLADTENEADKTPEKDTLPAKNTAQKNSPTTENRDESKRFVEDLLKISSKLKMLRTDKEALQKILEAELNHINTRLGKTEICIPLWCNPLKHHRVLQISAENAIILNSAERVPYMVYIEILEDGEKTRTPSQKSFLTKADTAPAKLPTARSPAGSSSEHVSKIRMAAILLAQLENMKASMGQNAANKIREKIVQEMKQKESQAGGSGVGLETEHLGEKHIQEMYQRDPSMKVISETNESREARIKESSEYSHLPNWKVLSFIVKETDMRQDQLGAQLIAEASRIFTEEGAGAWVRPYKMLVSRNGALIEEVSNAYSVHSIRKHAYAAGWNQPGMAYTLRDHFLNMFGDPEGEEFRTAQTNFLRSLVGYSLVNYLFQIKDRHNGNILVDREGHLVHIDFGFILSSSPGYVDLENKHFKFTQEYTDLLGGPESREFGLFREMLFEGFLALRKHAPRILILVEVLRKNSSLPCFQAGDATLADLRSRLQFSLTDKQLRVYTDHMLESSMYSSYSRVYDSYQYYANGIL
ncbi:MAG: phosphatidylinositol 4-kinase beta [Amphiamblys sp. WSBS2006]|nr:MAG: phosphatidylinositol 4-kinase beta [Amphiamblys sp. WSBS2006]